MFEVTNSRVRRLAIVAIATIQLSAHAGQKTAVVYTNGVNVSEAVALTHLNRIKGALYSAPIDRYELRNNYVFLLGYNPTSGNPIFDAFEAVKQDMRGDVSQFIRYISGDALMPESIARKLEKVYTDIDDFSRVFIPGVGEISRKYNQRICSGERVIAIAHSQGNYYVNSAYTGLNGDNEQYFEAISIANPDNQVAGGGQYTTEKRDVVILGITAAKFALKLPSESYPMTPNELNSNWHGDKLYHGFETTYIGGTQTRNKILNDIGYAANTLPSSPYDFRHLISSDGKRITINFDDVDATSGPIAISDQYQCLGIQFDGLTIVKGTNNPAYGLEAYSGIVSLPNVGHINDEPPFRLEVKISFDNPVNSFSATFIDANVDTNLIQLTALDASGNVIRRLDRNTPQQEYAVIEIVAENISEVIMSTDRDGTIVDNISFTR